MANLSTKTNFQSYKLPSDGSAGYSQDLARKDIEYLYEKLSKFSRTTTQWDLYKITQVVYDKNKFTSQINSLPPYCSAIIGSRFVDEKGNNYNVGDLVFKEIDNSTSHIKAERGGIFFPFKITKEGNNFSVSFKYLNKEPDEGTTVIDVNANGEVETPKQNIYFSNIETTNPAENLYYGDAKTPADGKVEFIKKNIRPNIKMYSSSGEEVYCSYSLGESGNNYIISNIPSIVKLVVIK